MGKGLTGAALAVVLLAAAGSASAQTGPATWVKRILVEMDAIQNGNGYRPVGVSRPGTLAGGGEARLEYALAGGSAYRFVVVCETGCGAGQVELLDPAGERVGQPGVLVEMPKLEAAPAAAGTYTLRVAMTECATAECAWSARLYARTEARPKRRK